MSNITKGTSKYKKKKKQKFYLFANIFVILLKIVSVKLLAKNKLRYLIYYFSEIHLIIQGSDNQQILNSEFEIEPSEVFVNGVKYDLCKKDCN